MRGLHNEHSTCYRRELLIKAAAFFINSSSLLAGFILRIYGAQTILSISVVDQVSLLFFIHCVPKSDAKLQITITTAHLIRINYSLTSFNYRLSGTNVANFNKIHHIVSEQQLFKNGT